MNLLPGRLLARMVCGRSSVLGRTLLGRVRMGHLREKSRSRRAGISLRSGGVRI